jgi:hypothetical protein
MEFTAEDAEVAEKGELNDEIQMTNDKRGVGEAWPQTANVAAAAI